MDHQRILYYVLGWRIYVNMLAMSAVAFFYIKFILRREHKRRAVNERALASTGVGPSATRLSYKRSHVVEIASEFIEAFDRDMSGARADMAMILRKMPDPPKGDLVQELKSLGLTEDEEVDVLIKFSHNPQYEKYFRQLEGAHRMAFVRRIKG